MIYSTLNIIIKPTNSCNMHCAYCYNREFSHADTILPYDYLRRFLELASDKYKLLNIYWHGGEPLLCGPDYMKKAVDLQRELFLKKGTVFTNSIQTNGSLINMKWVNLFKRYNFSVGVSYDGNANSRYREQSDIVLSRIKLLRMSGVKCACLCVAADDDTDLIRDYRLFSQLRVPYELSPLFPEGGAEKMPPLSAEKYISRLNELFHIWLYDKHGVDVRIFSEYIAMLMGSVKKVCTNGSCHGKWLCLSPDGSITNCGRHDVSQYIFGNINEINDISELFASEGFTTLLEKAISRRELCKSSCAYFKYCQGGCTDCAIAASRDASVPSDFACTVFRGVFSQVESEFASVIEKKIPLSELNPAVRAVAVRCMSE